MVARAAARAAARAVVWAAGLQAGVALAVVTEEVPFVVTPDEVTLAMLELAGVGPRDHVIDLGSGDGRIVITAARRFGASGLGVEIVADLVAQSRRAAQAAGVADRVDFREQDLFRTDLSPATVVTMYLLPQVNLQLRPRLLALSPGTRIVSHDWDMGDWMPERTLTIDRPDKPLGREKVSRVHLWTVPARVHGRWCTDGGTLEIVQRFDRFSAAVQATGAAAPAIVFDGKVGVHRMEASGPLPVTIVIEADGLRPTLPGPDGTRLSGRLFRPAGPAGCG